ncbi:MAG TPA: sialidase family protein [Casimicrobiaceae bacterium]|nr:sialidase family protein [Casimicrobiaceae bacterium]
MRDNARRALYTIALALAFAAGTPARAQTVTVIEYYNVALDHYFITSLQPDIDALDSGHFFGWSRTGLSFQAFADQASGGSGVNPVCRFYIPPPADSHFFSASPAECAQVLAKIPTDPNYRDFLYETANAFYIAVPDLTTGACPAGTVPVYRLWNQRADSNHRYTADPATKAQMVAKGYVAEGYGPDAVIMCAPGAAKGDTTVRVSGFSPFAPGCDGLPASGVLYRGAEVEPMVARNPVIPNHLIGVWQQDRWSDGGAAGHGTGVSFDGGRTWSRSQATLSRCTGGNAANGGDYPRVSDPWVTIGPDGAAYQIAIAFGGALLQPNSFGAVLVSRSADGGQTWGPATTLIRDDSTAFNDKESITADPTNASLVYATWERFADSNQDHAPTWFARTTSGGAAWEPARPIYDPGAPNSTLNNQIVLLPDGTLVLFFSEFDTVGNLTNVFLRVIRSQDHGDNWSVPVTIAQSMSRGARSPETGTPIRDGSNLGSIAVDKNGVLAVTWQDSRFSGGARDGIAFSRSFDGGLSWSPPVQINSAPGVQAWLPTATIRDDGMIGVTYYDFRNHVLGAQTLLTDYWLTTSGDGVNWHENHVAGPFDVATAPFAEGLFLGDYQGLTSVAYTFVPFYVTTNANSPSNQTDVFATLLTTSVPIPAAGTVKAAAPTLRAVVAPALPMTPELQQSLSDTARLTLRRRWMDRAPTPVAAP